MSVVDGLIYRSAEMTPQQLLERANDYGIKTVIDFRKTLDDVALEKQILEKKQYSINQYPFRNGAR